MAPTHPKSLSPAAMARPRVAMIGKFFPPVRGGIEEYVMRLADAVGEAVDLTVIVHSASRGSNRERRRGYDVVHCATYATVLSQPLSPGLLLALARSRFDIVHLHVPNVLGLVAVWLFARKARIVITHHADMVGFGALGSLARWLYGRVVRRADAVTVLSLKNKMHARDLAGISTPVVALPVALDPSDFEPTPDKLAAARQRRLSLGDPTCVFVFVGRLVPYKGLDVLITALGEQRLANSACLIVGDGPERARLEELARDQGCEKRVHFLGSVSEADRIAALHAADVFVLPSVTSAEAFGIAQVEGQLAGLPVITTSLPTAVSEVTSDGITGLLVPPGDAAELAEAMVRLGRDGELRRRLGAAGRERALARYSAAAVRSAALRLYLGEAATERVPAPAPSFREASYERLS